MLKIDNIKTDNKVPSMLKMKTLDNLEFDLNLSNPDKNNEKDLKLTDILNLVENNQKNKKPSFNESFLNLKKIDLLKKQSENTVI